MPIHILCLVLLLLLLSLLDIFLGENLKQTVLSHWVGKIVDHKNGNNIWSNTMKYRENGAVHIVYLCVPLPPSWTFSREKDDMRHVKYALSESYLRRHMSVRWGRRTPSVRKVECLQIISARLDSTHLDITWKWLGKQEKVVFRLKCKIEVKRRERFDTLNLPQLNERFMFSLSLRLCKQTYRKVD